MATLSCEQCGMDFKVQAADAHLRRHCSRRCSALNRRKSDPAVRFWSFVDRNGPVPTIRPELGPCWLWKGARNRRGYGRFWDGARARLAHVWSFEQRRGAVPEGLELDHLCMNQSCVRPDHLEPVTHQENNQRAEAATGQLSKLSKERFASRGKKELPAAVFQRSKTHCPAGHPYDAANTRVSPTGRRNCRACARERWRRNNGGMVADERLVG
jgi:hypothetical protein